MSFKVVEAKSWQWYSSVIALSLLLLLLALYIGWTMGRDSKINLEHEISQQTTTNIELNQKLDRLDQNALNLDSREKIAQASVQQASQDILNLQEKNKSLEKELTFYRSIMAPELDQFGLNIESFIIQAGIGENYHFSLTLTQVKKQDWYLKGKFNISIIGQQGGKVAKLNIKTLMPQQPLKMVFSFRYFQKIDGQMTLPEGFKPSSVIINASTNNKKQKTQKEFPWELIEALDV